MTKMRSATIIVTSLTRSMIPSSKQHMRKSENPLTETPTKKHGRKKKAKY